MTPTLEHSHQQLDRWSSSAVANGWLKQSSALKLKAHTSATPGSLFEHSDRPLVVSFFGGTGVGKSSLLNRLAGEMIATSSAIRPTSKAITAYKHEHTKLAALPDGFPLEHLNTASHSKAEFESLLWVDMPDFDSVEITHQDMVSQWLPYIDVVVYVVSPERYRDDRGWRLLLEHGSRHAWAFVINHWDKGDPRQLADFTQQLIEAGLADPLIFCTDSRPRSDTETNQTEDQFEALKSHILSLADQQMVARLEERGVIQRARLFRDIVRDWQVELGSDADPNWLQCEWRALFKSQRTKLTDLHQWKIHPIAAQHQDTETGLLSSLFRRQKPKGEHTQKDEAPPLIDDALVTDITSSVEQLIQSAHQHGLPTTPLKKALDAQLEQHRQQLTESTQHSLQQSLANPGTAVQRGLYRLTGWASWILPVAMMTWAAYRLITVFQTSGGNAGAYLGGNFAIHTALLVLLAWLVPYVLHRQLKPSKATAAAKGLSAGLDRGFDAIDESVQHSLSHYHQQRLTQAKELEEISAALQVSLTHELPAAVQRMVFAAE